MTADRQGSMRLELSADEQARAVAARSAPLRLGDLVRTLRRHPRLGRDLAVALIQGAKAGVRDDPGLLWAVDIERIRRAVPDAAIGAGWHGLDEFLSVLEPRLRTDMRVLELGCGGGRVSDRVAPLVGELVASDVSEALLEEARHNLSGHPNVTFQPTSGFSLSELPDDHFDAAYAHDVFVTFDPDPALALLDSTARKVRPGGAVVASFFTVDRPEWQQIYLAQMRRARASGRFGSSNARPFVASQLTLYFEMLGMDVEWSGYPDPDGTGNRHFVVVGRVESHP